MIQPARVLLVACLLLLPGVARAQAIDQTGGVDSAGPVMQTGPVLVPAALDAIRIPTEQEKVDVLQKTLSLLAKLPQKTQDGLLDEANRNKQYCQHNPMLKNFFDCSCFSLRMLDTRLRVGPDMPVNNMIRGTNLDICADQVAAAGYSYQRCQDMLKSDYLSDKDSNAMCECAARSMTQAWAKRPAASIASVNGLYLQAMMNCQTTLQPAGLVPLDTSPTDATQEPALP